MMIIKGKRATVQSGNVRATSNQQQRMEVQKHWPGLLPSAYPDPSLIYGVIQKKPADVRMPAILDTRKAQTAKQTYMNEM